MKKLIRAVLPIPIYGGKLEVVIAATLAEAASLSRNLDQDPCQHECEGCGAFVWTNGWKHTIVADHKTSQVGFLHEVMHVAESILHDRGVPYKLHKAEALHYLHDFLSSELVPIWTKLKKLTHQPSTGKMKMKSIKRQKKNP